MNDITEKDFPQFHTYLNDFVWEMVRNYPPGSLLDIPAGPGYFARMAGKHGFESVAGEIDESLHVFDDVSYKKIDMAEELPFSSDSFDYIVSIEGIEHIENQFKFLRECFRVLKKGGMLFLTTPNASSLESRFSFFLTDFHDYPARPVRDDLPDIYMEHINLIPFHRLETFIRFAGFKLEKLSTYRLRKGSIILYPILYPVAYIRYRLAFRKLFKGKPDDLRYWSIYKSYLSRDVLCGSHLVITAVKK